MTSPVLLDCTLRDGGYYNAWDFPPETINRYLVAMQAAGVDYVELGFRFLKNNGFKGPCAYTTDDFIRTLTIPEGLGVAVMVNGADLLTDYGFEETLALLFPERAEETPVELVRFACHVHEFPKVLPAVGWLFERGYRIGFNLMQIADRSREEVVGLARQAKEWPIEVLYFADSMGSMTPDDAGQIIAWLREEWDGPIGVHTHDNMGLALSNTLRAHAAGATWLDATVTGMGRGPGNARTEELVIEAADLRGTQPNLVPLMDLIQAYFQPMKNRHGWGSNPYYYLSGKYGIHPTYIQEMLADPRYSAEDILAVIEHLKREGGKKFSTSRLELARSFYSGPAIGHWAPAEKIAGRDVLLLGAGPGASVHAAALERYIRRHAPLVIALNTQSALPSGLIDLRVACHPVRLLADCEAHAALPQPLVTPASMLPEAIRTALKGKELLDFGISVEPGTFSFGDTGCTLPNSLVIAYALAMAASGKARRILLAGFDGYPAGDPRNDEMDSLFELIVATPEAPPITAITPCAYKAVPETSVYGN